RRHALLQQLLGRQPPPLPQPLPRRPYRRPEDMQAHPWRVRDRRRSRPAYAADPSQCGQWQSADRGDDDRRLADGAAPHRHGAALGPDRTAGPGHRDRRGEARPLPPGLPPRRAVPALRRLTSTNRRDETMRQVIKTHLPGDEAPIEWAVSADGILYTAQIPIRSDGSIETGDIGKQADLTFDNLKRSLEAAGGS